MNGAIEIVTGTLGGGKTLFEVERGYEHLRRGGWWFTNIEMHPEEVRKKMAEDGVEFDSQRLVILTGDVSTFHTQVARGTSKSLVRVTIDEAGLSFNSRDWAKTDRALLTFNTLARKLDILLVYITQDINDIDKQFRRKAGVYWVCRNMRHYKILGVLPLPIPLMFRVPFDNTQAKPTRMHPDIAVRKSWAFKLYNTDALLFAAGSQAATMKTVTGEPLRRLRPEERPARRSNLPYSLASLCAAFSYCFFLQF